MSDTTQPQDDEFSGKRGFTSKEAARYIGFSEQFLRDDRVNGRRKGRTPGPDYLVIGDTKRIRYLKDDLDAWLESFKVQRPGVPDPLEESRARTKSQ